MGRIFKRTSQWVCNLMLASSRRRVWTVSSTYPQYVYNPPPALPPTGGRLNVLSSSRMLSHPETIALCRPTKPSRPTHILHLLHVPTPFYDPLPRGQGRWRQGSLLQPVERGVGSVGTDVTGAADTRCGDDGRYRGSERLHRAVQLSLDAAPEPGQKGALRNTTVPGSAYI